MADKPEKLKFQLPPDVKEVDGKSEKITLEYVIEDYTSDDVVRELRNLKDQGYSVDVTFKVKKEKEEEE